MAESQRSSSSSDSVHPNNTMMVTTGKRKRKSLEEMQFGEDGEAVGNQLEDLDRRKEMEARGEEVVEDQEPHVGGKKKRVRKKQAARLAKQLDDATAVRTSEQAEAIGKAERKARKKREKRERRKLRKLGEAAKTAAATEVVAVAAPAPALLPASPAVDGGSTGHTLSRDAGSHKERKKRKRDKRETHEPREVHKIGGVSVNRLASYGTDVVKKAKKQAKRRRKAK